MDAPETENWPIGQSTQFVELGPAYDPPEQLEHVAEPLSEAIVPAAHTPHAEAPDEAYIPGEQLEQLVAPICG